MAGGVAEIVYKSAAKICRLCLKSCENSIAIFDENNLINDQTLKQCIEGLSMISLSPDDNLPETTCQQCFKLLHDFCAFVIQVRKNDDFLRNILECEYIRNEDDSESNLHQNIEVISEDIEKEESVNENLNTCDYNASNSDSNGSVDPEEGHLPQVIEITYIHPPNIHNEPTEVGILDPDVGSQGPIKCSYCSKMFAKKRYKLEHEKYHIQDGRKCPHCDKRFHKKYNWSRHVNSHTLERKFTCTVCQKLFITQSELNRHMKVHNPARDHKCGMCGNEFKDITAMKFHIRTVHYKERPFCCANCRKSFTTSSKLRRHQKSCTETKLITTIHYGCSEKFTILEGNLPENVSGLRNKNEYEINNELDRKLMIMEFVD